ncbi:Acetyltransferase [compost metagenome]
MNHEVEIKELKVLNAEKLAQLSELLVAAVDQGASIGFMPPMDLQEAEAYWQEALKPDVLLWVAEADDRIIGTVQLQLAMKKNGLHRAEVAKLMVHPEFRKKGIARKLMNTLEIAAKNINRSLLVLDTRSGDPSNLLYVSLGFIKAGVIPHYAKSSGGELLDTIFYYKEI